MTIIKRTIFFITLTFLLLFPTTTLAQEKINNFDVSIVGHQDGRMSIEEKIEYDFGEDERHGIFRNIPLVATVGDLYRVIEIEFVDIKRDGQDERYEVDLEPKETQVKIGDPDKTITGVHTYTIIYKVANGIGSNYEDHDEIYWNVTGNDWEIPILSASATITTDFGVETNRVACFTRSGDFNAQFCTFPPNSFNPITTTAPLEPGDGLTIVASFPVNTFPKSILQKDEPFVDPDFTNFLKIYLPIVAGLNFLLAPYLLFWYHQNKSKQRFGKPTVNFDIPKIAPAEAGTVDNTKLEKDDVIATIFDLAIRKYIKIEEVKKIKTLWPDETDYKITELKKSDGLLDYEKELLSGIFKGSGKVAFIKDIKKDFYLTFQKLEDQVFDSLIEKNLYHKNPLVQMTGLFIFGIIALVTLNPILGAILIYLSKKLNGRTQLGDKTDWQIDGLKIFLKAMSRHHGWQAKNLITVEKYIPFAIALGLHDQFMEQLKIIYPKYSPSWYSGSGNFYRGYGGMYSSMSSNVTTSAPSKSSGFSGGSSGGGGGGGGGGSW